jgi:predicted metal-dependent phosphoesterase TrpH
MFKTELHCHSKGVSTCGQVDAQEITQKFTEAGYATLVLTNHLSEYIYNHHNKKDWNEFVDFFLSDYEQLKAEAEGKLTILLGAELRFQETGDNDYLCFGFDETFLRENPYLYRSSVWDFHKLCQEKGYLFIQAHPFRNGMKIVRPDHIDGVEVFNGHPGHDSRNEIATAWANKFSHLIQTSGTDFHYMQAPANGGILTEEKIQTASQLVEVLKNGNYQLLK